MVLPDLRSDWDITAAAPRRRRLAPARRVAKAAVLALLATMAISLAAFLVPPLFGHKTLLVRGDSMGRGYPIGSLTVARTVSADDVGVGDVIFIEKKGRAPVLHRVTAVHDSGGGIAVETKGDANKTADADRYRLPDEVPVATYHLPYLGYLVAWVGTPAGWIALVVVPASLLSASLLVQIWSAAARHPALEWISWSPARHV